METVNLSSEEVANILIIRSDYDRNLKWLLTHYDDLVTYHPDEYVAVYDEKTVAFANSMEDLIHEIENQEGIDIRSLATRKLSSKSDDLFL